MNYEETYTENKKPFIFSGVMGRLAFFGFGFAYSLLMFGLIWLFCPKTISILANSPISAGKAPIEVMFSFSPIHETVLYIGIVLVFMCLFFILHKKRLLDIMGEQNDSLKSALLFSLVLFIMNLQSNFFVVPGTVYAVILSVGFLIVNLFLYFKKGKITGKK